MLKMLEMCVICIFIFVVQSLFISLLCDAHADPLYSWILCEGFYMLFENAIEMRNSLDLNNTFLKNINRYKENKFSSTFNYVRFDSSNETISSRLKA